MISDGHAFWGALILSAGALLLTLSIMWALLPNPHRGFTPPPLDRGGYTYTCYCWRDSVHVTVLAGPPRRGRHARRTRTPLHHRLRPNPPSAARADGGGEGERPRRPRPRPWGYVRAVIPGRRAPALRGPSGGRPAARPRPT
ncbi:hypothetical protein LUX12_10005 [Streptomyces somaliensis]|uniref:hypothetical protein n=1 Tax=Streptomyces somaliensis TaxID=78355 RepID=UPI0020CEF6F5|nr:hypothetical protein [Streptomyces somaliensis]MCP9945038.1 hypothetical protein [Streptomyces somaliensis]MCP9961746.1 hypothetical protein [Streptomyces somaliensis]MCP9974561.1 hypothetical protein [Streptomyces somaliensis]